MSGKSQVPLASSTVPMSIVFVPIVGEASKWTFKGKEGEKEETEGEREKEERTDRLVKYIQTIWPLSIQPPTQAPTLLTCRVRKWRERERERERERKSK